MQYLIESLIRPSSLNIKKICNRSYKIIIEPLERGFGNTIGNSLRRILLSYIPGYSITEMEIEGILHEFSFKDGIKEDIMDIMLNIKNMPLSLNNKNEITLFINKTGLGKVLSKDIVYNNYVNIINPDHLICTITKENTTFNAKLKVEKGIGYREIKYNGIDIKDKFGKLFIDSYFNPVEKVSYIVENTRFENKNNLDKLIINIETNGSIEIEEIIKTSVLILIKQLDIFLNIKSKKDIVDDYNNLDLNNNIFLKKIDDLKLTVRSLNCLKSKNINLLGDLIQKNENELLKIPNFGKKSLSEINNILNKYNLSLETKIDNWNIIKENINK
ncbi:DNA-directed RNA polymerase subunit alpha [endosymbiont of Sipalinus gigas]|uniref:DNA-directed RNA polymerase subunit alpha n=1 Tax=endosymbiont of Sipalinus gigas TaxID=1972134 RepID=UPI000DC707A6|nr:DNA-directed RNA polymerase subunit alpha [endosymbiont of Sipalinus gigas]BBA85241.1 DNA-directed RNA polymerase subunit alpha [endosymbiont of Sipalinus gigas]